MGRFRFAGMAVLALGLAFPALAQTPAAAPPAPLAPLSEAIRPSRLAGLGLNVVDIEKERAFYVDVLGMKVVQRVPAQGPIREYLLSFSADTASGPLLALSKTDKASTGAGDFGRVIFTVPNGAELARRSAAAGYPPTRITEGTNIITDPEGHRIELFQRAPAPAAR
jgi:catechol 2,3-dioxygenase-like lactoylglutathione lyase family enzyme